MATGRESAFGKVGLIAAALVRGVVALVSWVLLALLTVYQRGISPFLTPSCRFFPSCSEYSRLSIVHHGPVRGVWLTVRRLGRCHPWHLGGIDWPPGVTASNCECGSQKRAASKNDAACIETSQD
jgi:putative membrane protein insertion efficiency factor